MVRKSSLSPNALSTLAAAVIQLMMITSDVNEADQLIFFFCGLVLFPPQARKAPKQHDAHHGVVSSKVPEEESLINYPKNIPGTILL